MQCDGVTQASRRCERPARIQFLKLDGVVWREVAHYCKAHAEGAGAMRLLRPYSWEYDAIVRVNGRGDIEGVIEAPGKDEGR